MYIFKARRTKYVRIHWKTESQKSLSDNEKKTHIHGSNSNNGTQIDFEINAKLNKINRKQAKKSTSNPFDFLLSHTQSCSLVQVWFFFFLRESSLSAKKKISKRLKHRSAPAPPVNKFYTIRPAINVLPYALIKILFFATRRPSNTYNHPILCEPLKIFMHADT